MRCIGNELCMELRDFLRLLWRERTIFGIMLLLGLLCGAAVYRLQSQWYSVETLLSVTRQGAAAETTDYQYDEYYRLQADERMADTVSRYLESRVGRTETARLAELSEVRSKEYVRENVAALRLSPTLIRVSFPTPTLTEGKRIAVALRLVGEQHLASLNEQAAEPHWFTLVDGGVSFRDGRFPFMPALGIGLASGFFIAFWVVLGRWYWYGRAPLSSGGAVNHRTSAGLDTPNE